MKRIWRAYHPEAVAEVGAEIELSPDESHYLRRVLRLGRGELVTLFDGKGGEWAAEIAAAGDRSVSLALTAELVDSVEPAIKVAIYQGLCRADRMELVIQKATELGVAAIHPLRSERSDSPRPSSRRLERWRKIALEACRQCGRRLIPEISPAEALPVISESSALAVLLDPAGGETPLADLLAGSPSGAVWLAVGPESGFSEVESGLAVAAGWRPAGLGPRVLRTESAGLAAAAIVLNLWGDLGRRSG